MPDSSDRLRIWCNLLLPDAARRALEDGVAGHTLVYANRVSASNLDTSPPDADLLASDVAFGQPNPRDMIESVQLKWVHLSTAGYTLYDRDDLRSALRARGSALTNSSSVYAEPCAQHVLAMLLALSRRLPQAWLDQQQRKWDYLPLRAQSRLLRGNSVAIVGYGAIGRRLVEMLAPFEMKITTVRRTPRDDEGVRSLPMERAAEAIATADHVVNLLPAGANTKEFFDAALFARIKRGAIFYNVGRGSTVDQAALLGALESKRLAAAYLDVTNPEPLPPDDPLWSAPNCHITPHSAGGHADEYERLVRHFLDNLDRYLTGQPLLDRIV
jgi:phosphoglycerate dehydrogenase-like enzyme